VAGRLAALKLADFVDKEGSVDYRYMPDPDIPPLIIGEDLLSSLRESIPTAPDALLHCSSDPSLICQSRMPNHSSS
jgi:Asp-tRNAAsn/Glu-tRNAGln amidotransferase B subunit (PET112 homolog)